MVSWKEAADSQDSVAKEALVIPMSSGRPEAGGALPSDTTRRFSSSKRARSASSPGEQVGVAGFDDGHAAQHLADDNLDVLVVDTNTLAAVNALNLVHKELLCGTGAMMRRTCFGSTGPLISFWPTLTCSPSSMRRRERRSTG